MRMWFDPMLGGGSGDYNIPFLRLDMGCSKGNVNQWQGRYFIMLMRSWRSAFLHCTLRTGDMRAKHFFSNLSCHSCIILT